MRKSQIREETALNLAQPRSTISSDQLHGTGHSLRN